MAGTERVNGHRPSGLSNILEPNMNSTNKPRREDFSFDLDTTLASVVKITSNVPEDAVSAKTLGTSREGSAISINDSGILLTIGYLVVDSDTIFLHLKNGRTIEATLIAYHHESGLALIQALSKTDMPFIPQVNKDNLKKGDSVIIAASGGIDKSISAKVVDRRQFAGSWEYMIDNAIFTKPFHPEWSGAALINEGGYLSGVGSLWLNDAEKVDDDSPGNMFVPIDLLTPIYADLLAHGQAKEPHRPWLGIYVAENMENLFISGVTLKGPAYMAGLNAGDILTTVNGKQVDSLPKLYRVLWSHGNAGVEFILTLIREGTEMEIRVKSDSRYNFISKRHNH